MVKLNKSNSIMLLDACNNYALPQSINPILLAEDYEFNGNEYSAVWAIPKAIDSILAMEQLLLDLFREHNCEFYDDDYYDYIPSYMDMILSGLAQGSKTYQDFHALSKFFFSHKSFRKIYNEDPEINLDYYRNPTEETYAALLEDANQISKLF